MSTEWKVYRLQVATMKTYLMWKLATKSNSIKIMYICLSANLSGRHVQKNISIFVGAETVSQGHRFMHYGIEFCTKWQLEYYPATEELVEYRVESTFSWGFRLLHC